MKHWFRTCQECGHVQKAKSPHEQQSENWRSLKCRQCKSEALDFGALREVDSQGKPLHNDDWAE